MSRTSWPPRSHTARYRVVRRRRYALAIVALPILTLVVAHWALHRAPGQLGEYEIANRVLGYVGVLSTLPLAALLGDGSRALARRVRGADIAVVAIVAGLVFASQGPWRDVPDQFGEPTAAMRAAAAELERVSSRPRRASRCNVTTRRRSSGRG